MIRIACIDHLVLRVADAEAMIDFYVGVLGCTLERAQQSIGLYQLRAGSCLIDLVPVDDKTMSELNRMNPGYHKLVIKAGTYPKQEKDVPAIGYTTHVIAACDLPEETVYKMTKAMATHIADMAAVVKPITGLTVKDMATDIGVPFHKGAARYYKEVGAM